MKINNSSRPLVTVLMTAYNTERFIDLAIKSLLKQTYRQLEIIVVDVGSTDKTAAKAVRRAKRDGRLTLFSLPRNCGPSLASNFGLERSRGQFLARMDADDIAFPDRIEKQVSFLDHHPEVVIVGGQCLLINEEGEIIGEKRFPTDHRVIYRSLFQMNPIQHPACMINRRLLPQGKIFYHNHSVLAHDLELVFELAQYGQLANLDEPVLYYRQSANSLSLRNPKETFRATFSIRNKALKAYHYHPSGRGWLSHFGQALAVALLPKGLIYPLFCRMRFRGVKMSQKGVAAGWRNIFNGALLREIPE